MKVDLANSTSRRRQQELFEGALRYVTRHHASRDFFDCSDLSAIECTGPRA